MLQRQELTLSPEMLAGDLGPVVSGFAAPMVPREGPGNRSSNSSEAENCLVDLFLDASVLNRGLSKVLSMVL